MTVSADGAGAPTDPWDQHARWWRETFTLGADAEYEEQILPLVVEHVGPAPRVLELGAGEGQVARAIAGGLAAHVVGIDRSAAQAREAVRRGGGPSFVRADAMAVPVASASTDAVVACLVLEHLDDLDGALDEVARVLVPGGRLVAVLNHPLLSTPGSGWIDDQVLDPPEQYWRVGPYLREGAHDEQVDNGVVIRFVHRPLSRYLNAMADRGFVLERMVEPPPPASYLAESGAFDDADAIPRLVLLVARLLP